MGLVLHRNLVILLSVVIDIVNVIGDCPGRIAPLQNVAQLLNMLGHDAARFVVFVQAIQSLVAVEWTILARQNIFDAQSALRRVQHNAGRLSVDPLRNAAGGTCA